MGDSVNAERAMAAHTRFGGHIVQVSVSSLRSHSALQPNHADPFQGHVDGTASIVSIVPDGNSIRFRFQFPPASASLMPFLVEKGYITIDGASLTLTEVDDAERTFGIMLIAHSQTKLTLTSKKEGDKVNIEADCVGKYVLGSQERIERLVDGVVERKMREKGLL